MATLDDAHRIASALPEATSDPGEFAYRVDGRLFAWIWMERVQPKRPRVPNREVIAIRVADESEKQAMLEAPDLKTRAEILIAVTEMDLAKKRTSGDTGLQ